MSVETIAIEHDTRIRRQALRVGFAVAVGLAWSVAAGDVIVFLGPLFAAQFLLGASGRMPVGKAVGMALLVLVVGAVIQWLTELVGMRPPVFLLVFGLIYLACFYIQARGKGGPAIFLIVVLAVMIPLLSILNINLGETMHWVLLKGVATGIVLTWIAHALIPDPGGPELVKSALAPNPRPLARALADATILSLIMVVCLVDERLGTAVVVPITVASLLMQLDIAATGRAALGVFAVNILGGLAGCFAFAILELRPTLWLLFLLTLIAGLVFGGRAVLAAPSAKVFGGALTIFLVIFGSGVSPLPGGAAESFSSRLGFILLAIGYVIFMLALLRPRTRAAIQTDGAA